MASLRRTTAYTDALNLIFGRRLLVRDGISEARLTRAEKRLRFSLPSAVREFYSLAGAAGECREHNHLYWPEDLTVEDERLVFMSENQGVVDWAVSLRPRPKADPEVWQRVSEDDAPWHSEEMTFSVFILKNLAWQRGVELSNKRMQLTRSALANGRRGPRS
jgi:hypothetical protein